MLPNFLVIGAAKAGTTSLHWYIVQHPAVFMTTVKDQPTSPMGWTLRGDCSGGTRTSTSSP